MAAMAGYTGPILHPYILQRPYLTGDGSVHIYSKKPRAFDCLREQRAKEKGLKDRFNIFVSMLLLYNPYKNNCLPLNLKVKYSVNLY